jgi:hypothetical protein
MTTQNTAVEEQPLVYSPQEEVLLPSSAPLGGETEPLQSPAEAPLAEVPAAPVATAPVPQIDISALQRQVLAQGQQIEAFQVRERQDQVKAYSARYKEELRATYNYSEEQLGVMTTQFEQFESAKLDMQRNHDSELNNERAKIQTAMHIGQLFGVNPQGLMRHNSPEAMKEAAEQSHKISYLEKEIDTFKKGSVPPQEFSNPNGAGNASENDFVAGMANGSIPMTEANANRLYNINHSGG